jgi:hypothetical protein
MQEEHQKLQILNITSDDKEMNTIIDRQSLLDDMKSLHIHHVIFS